MTVKEINAMLARLEDDYALRHNKGIVSQLFLAIQKQPQKKRLMNRLEDVLRVTYDPTKEMHYVIN